MIVMAMMMIVMVMIMIVMVMMMIVMVMIMTNKKRCRGPTLHYISLADLIIRILITLVLRNDQKKKMVSMKLRSERRTFLQYMCTPRCNLLKKFSP